MSEKLCPFTLGKVIPSICITKDCMAWRASEKRWVVIRDGTDLKPIIKTFDGYCKCLES